jgi:hypothetical protein
MVVIYGQIDAEPHFQVCALAVEVKISSSGSRLSVESVTALITKPLLKSTGNSNHADCAAW